MRAKIYKLSRPTVVDLSSTLNDAEVIKLKQENENLRKLIGANLPASWQFIPAKILTLKNDQLTVAVGTNDGIKMGMAVLAIGNADVHSGVLIGKISQANNLNSTASLIDNVKVKTGAGASGRLSRQNQLLELLEVRQNQFLNQGDLVVTAGGDGWLPDLAIGRIGKITTVATSVYQSAEVVPIIDPKDLAQVFIVKLPLQN